MLVDGAPRLLPAGTVLYRISILAMTTQILNDEAREFTARAILVGQRIDLRALGSTQRLGGGPLAVSVRGGGAAILFRYGALVLFDVQPLEEDEFLRQLEPRVQAQAGEREVEQITVRIDPESKEVLEGNRVILKDTGTERLEIVADILSKSVVLARYESSVAQTFDRIEPFAAELTKEKAGSRMARELLSHLGSALLIEQQMVGRVQIDDTPEILWDRPDLERLFARLRDEFEIIERFTALNRKLELISRTVETALGLIQARRSLRVEWYIVILIVFEIMLTLYQMFWLGTRH
jgi:required for meiotic nuclear division protein 1